MSGYEMLARNEEALKRDVEIIRAHVSPWLWVLPILGFSLALWNKFQISKMYSHFRGLR